MANFMIAFDKTSIAEGGYANNPRDTGGETYRGISRNNEPKWKGWPIIDSIKKKVGTRAAAINKEAATNSTLQNHVKSLYKEKYWNGLNLDLIQDQQMANELYDTGVNMGTGRAGLFFQRVLNVCSSASLTLDGKIGPKTIAAFNSLSQSDRYMAWKLFNCLQGEKYISICENNPSQKIFIRSWASRVFET